MNDEIEKIMRTNHYGYAHTKEIKEILDNLKDIDKTSILKNNDAKILLDYITNLQEELKSANESITWWHNRFNAKNNGFKSTLEELCETTEQFEKLQEKYEKMKENAEILLKGYNKLEKENEILKENAIHNDKVVDKAKWNEMLYKSRNEKAIDIYENSTSIKYKKKRFMEDKSTSDLMYETLTGGDKDVNITN